VIETLDISSTIQRRFFRLIREKMKGRRETAGERQGRRKGSLELGNFSKQGPVSLLSDTGSKLGLRPLIHHDRPESNAHPPHDELPHQLSNPARPPRP